MREYAVRVDALGQPVLRYSLVFFFVAFGLYKFTPTEAQGIEPLVAHSPLLSWLYDLFDVRIASDVIGLVEIAIGALIATRRFSPRASALGSLLAAAVLCVTMSFLVTTPDLPPDVQGFLMKDVTLFGAALFTAGEALLSFASAKEPRSRAGAVFGQL
jgi:reactive chlorine resistance protein C